MAYTLNLTVREEFQAYMIYLPVGFTRGGESRMCRLTKTSNLDKYISSMKVSCGVHNVNREGPNPKIGEVRV